MFRAIVFSLAMAFSSAASATVLVPDTDNYLYQDVLIHNVYLTGPSAPGSFTFNVTSKAGTLAHTSMLFTLYNGTPVLSSITDPYLSVFDGVATITKNFVLGYDGTFIFDRIDMEFLAPDQLIQTVTVGWSGFTGPVGGQLGVYWERPSGPSAIPVPAAGVLLLGALGSLLAVQRRRRIAALA